MNEAKLEVKLSYITGLKEIVKDEISKEHLFRITGYGDDSIYTEFVEGLLPAVKHLRSVARAYITARDSRYNPAYLFNHKSVVGDLIEIVTGNSEDKFKSFKITCAGSDSTEVKGIVKYVHETYELVEKEKADLKIHIIKLDDIWELGIQTTARPLSVRDYKVRNMSGAMDPTIAYALNSLCKMENAKSYLNVFSGSATLLIEAGQCYKNLEKMIGFDNNKKHLSLAIQNIKKAGLITKVQLKEENILNKPNLGTFDVITSDLPFGMTISKGENLEKLYECFVEYCENTLNKDGILAVYTSEHDTLEKTILKSRFQVIKTMQLKFITNVDAYLRLKIFVCKYKN